MSRSDSKAPKQAAHEIPTLPGAEAEVMSKMPGMTQEDMRQAMAHGMTLDDPRGRKETIPSIDCRVLVAGKTSGFTGILPGLYEELLYCFEVEKPVFILGAYGGAGGKVADYLNGKLKRKDAFLDLEALKEATPDLARVEAGFDAFPWPEAARRPAEALQLLVEHLTAGKKDIPTKLRNGLSQEENLRLFAVADTAEAAELILRGLSRVYKGGNGSRKKARARKS